MHGSIQRKNISYYCLLSKTRRFKQYILDAIGGQQQKKTDLRDRGCYGMDYIHVV
jgi:hypothetical protein